MFGVQGFAKGEGRGVFGSVVVLLLAVALLLPGCAGMSQRESTAWGALGGAAAGAATGAAVTHHHTRGALVGAGIGAVAGALIGAAVGEQTEEREVPPPPEVVVRPAPPSGEALVELPGLTMDPPRIPAGARVTLRGVCQTYGRAAQAPSGEVRLVRGDAVLAQAPLVLSHLGRVEFAKSITIPAEYERGVYTVEVHLQYGSSSVDKAVSFRVE